MEYHQTEGLYYNSLEKNHSALQSVISCREGDPWRVIFMPLIRNSIYTHGLSQSHSAKQAPVKRKKLPGDMLEACRLDLTMDMLCLPLHPHHHQQL